jgi:Tol biopolymer transport system component
VKPFIAVSVIAVVAIVQAAGAQGARVPKPAFATEVVSSDSVAVIGASESPDGRWIIFGSSIRTGPTHLWIMPAGGGALRRLTDGNHNDDNPVWFPSGGRIAFISDRVHGIMTSDFDPVTGRLTGAMKRVSLEDAMWHDVSPDGAHIVYKDLRNRLRLIPATGGSAVTILDYSAAGQPILASPKFSADGREVFVSSRGPGGSTPATLLRVASTGGAVTPAYVGPNDAVFWGVVADPTKDRMLVSSDRGTAVVTMRGDTIAMLPAQAGNQLARFTHDGRFLLKGTSAFSAVVRLVPTSGGTPLDVTPGEGSDWPIAWSSDGMRIYSSVGDTTPERFKKGLMVSSVKGGERRFIPFAPTDTAARWRFWRQVVLLGDGRYWALVPRLPQPTVPLLIYDAQTRATREVTRNAIRMLPNPAGSTAGSSELVYIEQHGAGHELRALRADGEPRLLHSTSRLRAPWLIALHGDRIALGEHVGDSTVLYFARGMGSEQRLTSIAGKVSDIAWSPDGRTLAGAVTSQRAGADVYSVMFWSVDDQGQASSAPRQASTNVAWDLAWLPDGRAVTLLEEQGNTNITRVLRVPVDTRQQPTSLTPNERGSFWGQSPSPDGRFIAIPAERVGASTLWRIDVDEAARAWRDKKGKTSSRPSGQ